MEMIRLFLTTPLNPQPTKPYRARTKAAQELGRSPETMRRYINIAFVAIPDFAADVPASEKADFTFPLTDYQFWVVRKISHTANVLRNQIGTRAYLEYLKRLIIEFSSLLSRTQFTNEVAYWNDQAVTVSAKIA